MKGVRLARVEPDLPILEAFKRIRPGTRALVINKPTGPLIVTAGDIMERRNSAVDAGEDIASVSIADVAPQSERHIDARVIVRTSEKYSQIFRIGNRKTRVLIAELHDEMPKDADTDAVVITRSDILARDLATFVTVCSCAGQPIHTYELGQLRVPGICNKPHRAIVTCSKVGELP